MVYDGGEDDYILPPNRTTYKKKGVKYFPPISCKGRKCSTPNMPENTPESIKIAQRLKGLREEKGLSHDKLSETLAKEYGINISKSSLINYEVTATHHVKATQNLGMSVKNLRCLADFYGVTTDYILGREDDPHRVPSAIDQLGVTEDAVTAISDAAAAGTIDQLNLLLAHQDLPTILKMLNKVSRAVTAELSHLKSLTAPGENGAYFENLDAPGSKVYIADLGSFGLRLAAEHEAEMIKGQILKTHPELQDRIIIEYGRDAIARHIETISSLFKYLVWDTTHYSDLDDFYVDMWRQNNCDD